jgi:UDP-glucose 4-epimerase
MGTALVTGGAGFIGSHVVEALLNAGNKVRVLDDLSSGRRDNLSAVADDVDFIEADIRLAEVVRRACAGVDTVYHLAAFISVPGSVADPVEADSVNIGGTLNVLLAARDARVRRVVFSSSSAVYGEPANVPVAENAATRPASPYGVEKLYGEHMCRLVWELYGVETVSLRYFNVYGPRQSPGSDYAAVIPKFVSAMVAGEAATIYGDGQQTRDFLYVQDVARANLLAATSPGAVGQRLNIASGCAASVLDIHTAIGRLTGSRAAPRHAESRPGDIRHSVADVREAEKAMGFRASVLLDQGLLHTVLWLSGHGA